MSEVSEKAARKGKLLEAIEKDPDSVILRSDVIFGAISGGEGRYGTQCGEYPSSVIKMACFDIQLRANMIFQQMEFQKALQAENEKRNEKRIVTPSCGTGIGAK